MFNSFPTEGEPGLPTSQNEEFRPFIRRLPEFKFWYSATKVGPLLPHLKFPTSPFTHLTLTPFLP